MRDLIDTTEMYLKTIYELEEDSIVPMRARIVERLGHTGPTVSQTIARMERDGLVVVESDRRLSLTEEGAELATEVMRKHRLAERLLVDVIGLDWARAHDEACRWEHVMSDCVEERLMKILECSKKDPYGNPIPGESEHVEGQVPLSQLRDKIKDGEALNVELVRIGEAVQTDERFLTSLSDIKMRPSDEISVTSEGGVLRITHASESAKSRGFVEIPGWAEPHIFVS
ncbi:MAG: iron dependent repressor, metal binding and dimerization domain protein [Actinomycetaceae bacterium]|nr:iron dependent repressor, metal binding and dimerization domain protein [Actinomycetaceae bacterium]